MLIVWLVLSYLLAHLAAYWFSLRRRGVFQTERGIFLFHFVSACLLPPAVFWFSMDWGVPHAILCAVLAAAAHGIYSLSFLELWSLAQGSYSFAILSNVESHSGAPKTIVSELSAIGDSKKDQRLQSLHRLRLIQRGPQFVSLTPRGRAVVAVLKILRYLANVSESA